jgi:probable addiction module antidote protein
MGQASGFIAGNKVRRLLSSSARVIRAPRKRISKRRKLFGKTISNGHKVQPGVLYETLLDQSLAGSMSETIAYLNACIQDTDPGVFLIALGDAIRAHGGMSAIAKKCGLNREGLYDMLSKSGNPTIKNLEALLHALGMRLAVTAV